MPQGRKPKNSKTTSKKSSNGANLGFEQKLWQAADKQDQATQTVLEQAELLCHEWAA